MPPALKALCAQGLGWTLAIALARSGWLGGGPWAFVAVQAGIAVSSAAWMRSAGWWLAIHAAFAPLLLVAGRLGIAPGWYLAAFALLLAVYWTSFRTQVPLFLSNRETVAAVATLLPHERPVRVLDIGSGTGTLLRGLARLRPDGSFEGIEAAPGPWLLSRLAAGGRNNLRVARGDFFAAPWSQYDVIYAFLSPVPMEPVWAKAERELRPGALLVSNSFPVPGRKPDKVVEVGDRRGTRLYVYEIAPAGWQGE